MINNNHQSHSFTETPEFDEINNYLNTPNDINIDPIMWWKEHQEKYPVLLLIAKDYLIIQVTSVAAEQAFSVAGNTITQTRNKLEPETARVTLCLKSWIENEIGIDVNNENYETSDNNSSSGDDHSDSDTSNSDGNSDNSSDNNSSDTNSD